MAVSACRLKTDVDFRLLAVAEAFAIQSDCRLDCSSLHPVVYAYRYKGSHLGCQSLLIAALHFSDARMQSLAASIECQSLVVSLYESVSVSVCISIYISIDILLLYDLFISLSLIVEGYRYSKQ